MDYLLGTAKSGKLAPLISFRFILVQLHSFGEDAELFSLTYSVSLPTLAHCVCVL